MAELWRAGQQPLRHPDPPNFRAHEGYARFRYPGRLPVDDSSLGRQRWPVEKTIGWLHQFRRLRTRWERRADIHEAFLSLACSIICLRKLRGSF